MQKVQIRVKSKESNTHYTNKAKTTKVSNTTPQTFFSIIKSNSNVYHNAKSPNQS